jgi:hypothetical protein
VISCGAEVLKNIYAFEFLKLVLQWKKHVELRVFMCGNRHVKTLEMYYKVESKIKSWNLFYAPCILITVNCSLSLR